MKTFTKTEVSWLINLLEEESRRLDATMTADGATSMEQALAAHKLSAQNAMRESWESTVKAWEYDAKEHKDEDECECCESTAVIRDDSDVESWRIEEQELDVQIAVRVKGGLVEEVHANADVSVEVYDLDVSDFPDDGEQDEADKKEVELEELVKSPGWRNVW